MDERNIRILKAIAKLGTGSTDAVSDFTDIPKSTVHYRLTKLKEEGVVINDQFDVNLEKIGLNLTVVTDVITEYDDQDNKKVGQKLASVEGVNQVYFTMGDTDFIAIAHLSTREMVHRLISDYEQIDEVVRTSSKFVIETVKDEPHPLNDFRIKTLLDTTESGE